MLNAKRILSALLASLMLLPTLAACSDEGAGTPADDTTVADTAADTTTAETEPRETERHEIKDDLPADLKFDGRTFTMYVGNQSTYDNFVMGVEEKEGDIVNDAVWERNLNVQEQLNFVLKADPYAMAYNTIAEGVSTLILAGDSTYDVFLGHQYGMATLVSRKMFVDGYTLEHINFDQPWWMNSYMDELTLGKGARYLLVSDFNTQAITYIRANFFNKTLYEKLYGDPNELYQMALDGKFTLDHMNQLIEGAYSDLNGDGQTDIADQLGMITTKLQAAVDSYVYGTDVVFTSRDKDGFVQLNMINDESVLLAEKLCAFFNQKAISTLADNKQNAIFAAGTSLFLGNGMLSAAGSTELREMADDFGILPHPKMDEDQKEYYSLVHDTAMLTGVSVQSKNLDMVGAVLEALAAESYRRVTPAWYESALKLKYARDDISSQMVDMIKDSMTTNFIYAYNAALNSLGTVYRTLITKNTPENFVSTIESKLPAAETSLAELVKTFKGE